MTRARALDLARACFLLLVVGCAWWGLRGRWDEIAHATGATGGWRLAAGLVCAVVGLALTGVLWRSRLAGLGSPIAAREASAVFFVGQLGKYIPGSVWSFAAQAQLGRRHGVPARSSLSASGIFLLVHTLSGLALGAVLLAGGAVPTDLARGWWVLLAVPSALVLAVVLWRRFGGAALVQSVVLMTGVWACYGLGLWWVAPGTAPFAAIAAFALAHAAGVLVVFAPAGVGAREAVLIALLAPATGVPAAAAAALLVRVTHTIGDFALAAAAAGWARQPQAEVADVTHA